MGTRRRRRTSEGQSFLSTWVSERTSRTTSTGGGTASDWKIWETPLSAEREELEDFLSVRNPGDSARPGSCRAGTHPVQRPTRLPVQLSCLPPGSIGPHVGNIQDRTGGWIRF